METVTDFILGGSKITANGDCAMKLKDSWYEVSFPRGSTSECRACNLE